MRWVIALLGTLIFTGCGCCGKFFCGFGGKVETLHVDCPYTLDIQEEVSRAVIDYSTRMRYEKHIRFEDSTTYFHIPPPPPPYIAEPPKPPVIDLIKVIYSSQAILELEEGRAFFVDVVEGLLQELNKSAAIKSRMENGSVSADDLEIYISFESFYMEYVDPTDVVWIVLKKGIVTMYMGSIKDVTRNKDFWDQRIEPYYKSKQFVMLEREADVMYRPAPQKNQFESTAIDLFNNNATQPIGNQYGLVNPVALPPKPITPAGGVAVPGVAPATPVPVGPTFVYGTGTSGAQTGVGLSQTGAGVAISHGTGTTGAASAGTTQLPSNAAASTGVAIGHGTATSGTGGG